VEAAGFRDSWRVAHPDPQTTPGLTWWAGRPPLEAYAPGANDPQDRIDFVWVAGAARTLSSELVGENDAQDVSLGVTPWPSDHRAVVSTFQATPAQVPRLLSPDRRVYGLDDDLVFIYRNAPSSEIEVAGIGAFEVSGRGELRVKANSIKVGHHAAKLHTPGHESIRSDFWVVDRSAVPAVSVSRISYKAGEAIEISWQNGPGNRNDYLGIYEAGIASTYLPDYDGGLTWLYVDALPEGTIRLDRASIEATWPLPPGKYVVRLLKDDGYEVLAESSEFEVL
jgi:hypothetical protein